uniref:Ras-related protein RABA5c-like n=1 Tax=Tanacetum cinerariifolium TaxID=118510 RepID=A0A6L2J249_TANCI|nr:Ras-related protein RABA5c-like [Tanacetum cinerariifolium]
MTIIAGGDSIFDDSSNGLETSAGSDEAQRAEQVQLKTGSTHMIRVQRLRDGLRELVSHLPILTDSIILILVLSSLAEVRLRVLVLREVYLFLKNGLRTLDKRPLYSITHSDTTVARMLVGNKCDLDNIRAVSVEDGKNLAETEGLFFMETSALDSTNVKTAFEMVIREIYNNVGRKALNSDSYKAELSVNRVTLTNDGDGESKQNQNKYSCCS